MTINATAVSALYDAAATIVLRDRSLNYTSDHHSPGIAVPRKGLPFWETGGDYDFTVRVTFTTTGTGPHAVEIWASNGDTVPDHHVLSVGLPDADSGEVRGLVCASALRAIPSNAPLFLSAKIVVGDGTVDAGVTLECE